MVDNANTSKCADVSLKTEFGEVKYEQEFTHCEDERVARLEEVTGEIANNDVFFGLDSFADEAVEKMLTITEVEFTVKVERFSDDEDGGEEDTFSQLSSNEFLFNTDNYKQQKGAPPPPKFRKDKPGICIFCNTGFPSAALYEDHMRTAHKKELPYSCQHCGKRFAAPQYAKRHEIIHNPHRFEGPPQFACDMCDKRYHLKVSLKGHRKKTHLGYKATARPTGAPLKQHHSMKGIKNPNPYKKPEETFPCPYCDRIFDWKSGLNRHVVCHKKDKPFICSICLQPCPLKKSLKAHIRKIHEMPTPTGIARSRPKWQAKQPCPCSICGKVFQVPSQLRRHSTVHTGEKPHNCETFGVQFRLVDGLRNHIKIHQPLDPMCNFKCRVCGKEGFKRLRDIRDHRMHAHKHLPIEGENEKPFPV